MRLEVLLSEKGKEEAVVVAKKFGGKKIYSSPITRARQTAEIIAKEIGAEVIIREELTARDQGEATGKTEEEIKKMEVKAEPLEEVRERAAKFINEIIQKDEDIIVVTHKKVIQMILSYVLNLNPEDVLKFSIDYAGIIKTRYNGFWKVLCVNC